MDTLKTKLSKAKFLGFDNINIADIFSIFSTVIEIGNEDPSFNWKNNLKRFIAYSCTDNYKYVFNKSENSKIIFSYTAIYYRQDHFNAFSNLMAGIENKDIIYPVFYKRRKFNIIKLIRLIPYLISCFFSAIRIKLKPFEIFFILSQLITIHELNRFIKKIDINSYKLLTVYYDVRADENFLVQYFKNSGIKTATLQHGIFMKPLNLPTNIDNAGVEFKYFISDYMLLWNQFSKDRAIAAGIDKNKLIVLGIPKYANFVREDNALVENKTFGIVLSILAHDGKNKQLIDIANKICNVFDYKYILRYHPNFNGTEYLDIVDKKYYAGISEKELSISDYTQTVEFSLISTSSVYIELIFLNHQVYRLACNDGSDKFEEISINVFSNSNELELLIKNKNSESIKSLFDYLCTTENIAENYQQFFNQFIR